MMKPITKSILRIGVGALLFSSASLAYAQCARVEGSGNPSIYGIYSYAIATSQNTSHVVAGGNATGINYGVLVRCSARAPVSIMSAALATANSQYTNWLNDYRTRYRAEFKTTPYLGPMTFQYIRAAQTGNPSAGRGGWEPALGASWQDVGINTMIYSTGGGYSAGGNGSVPAGDYYVRATIDYSLHSDTRYGPAGLITGGIFDVPSFINIGGVMVSFILNYSGQGGGSSGVVDPPPPVTMSCGIGLKLTPDDGRINFGQMSTSDLNNGRSVTRELTLSVGRKEACNRNQNITMTFNPDTKGLISGASASFSQGVMRLENNTRIEIRDKSNNAAVNLTPGTKFNFGSLPQQTSGVNTNPARLDKIFSFTWKRDGTSPVKVGTWNAQILLEIEGD